MKAYKGFNRNADGTMSCRGFVYEIGKTYKYDGKIEICLRGFHACHELHQVWNFYANNGNNVFYEVECGGVIIESKFDDGKFVCSEITLIREIDVSDVEVFDDSSEFWNGYACVVRKDGKQNNIDKQGKTVSDEWFDYMGFVYDGKAKVKQDGEYYMFDIKTKTKDLLIL